MIILAGDTSTDNMSVALWNTQGPIAEINLRGKRAHAEQLLSAVDTVLKHANLPLKQVDLLAISNGPGSFTGLRIGVATWKGLALGAHLPLMAVPTLDAMARRIAPPQETACVMLDARMKEVYAAAYHWHGEHRTKLIEDCAAPPHAICAQLKAPCLFLGDGAILYRSLILEHIPQARFAPQPFNQPRAWAVAAEAAARLAQDLPADAATVKPIYLRQSQPEETRARATRGANTP